MNKVLIVEDDQIVANIYRNKLAVEGFEVEIAHDGLEGIDIVRSFQPHAVILDLMLPKMTGVELTRQIRAEPGCEQVPVIVFSNTYLTNMVQEAWKAGATKCLSKANATPKQLIDVIRTALGTNGAKAPIGAQPNAPAAPAGNPQPSRSGNLQPATSNQQLATSNLQPATSNLQPGSPGTPATLNPQPGSPGTPAPDADAEFQADLRKSFIQGLPSALANLRTHLQSLIKADKEDVRIKTAQEMYRRIHALTGNAGLSGLSRFAHMGDALEALLKELFEKPQNMNPSTLRTVATAIDFLNVLFERGLGEEKPEAKPPSILVVDDEAISRRAVTYALEKARLKSVSVEDPVVAYKLIAEGQFDLIFLDVDMPGMTGFELCTKLRALPAYKKVPVVFVTSLNDFESRANSTMSGGNDFIGKPFLFIELAVKALMYVMRGRLPAPAAAK